MQNPNDQTPKSSPHKRNKKYHKPVASKKNIDKHGLFKYQQKNTSSPADSSELSSFIPKDKLSVLESKYWKDSMANSEYLESLSENARMLPDDDNEFAEWIAAIEERKSNLKRS